MGLFADQPDLVNSRGDVFTEDMRNTLYGSQYDLDTQKYIGSKMDPVKAAEMLTNWLTAGGPPKPTDPGKIFGDSAKLSGVHAKASAGQGINGLFGIGNMIGDLSPAPPTVGVEPIKMIEPLNQSPMQAGVPYSVPPLAGGKR